MFQENLQEIVSTVFLYLVCVIEEESSNRRWELDGALVKNTEKRGKSPVQVRQDLVNLATCLIKKSFFFEKNKRVK